MPFPTADEIRQLEFEPACSEEILHPTRAFTEALAFDRKLAENGEHPLRKWVIKPNADPLFPSAGSPGGTNDMFERNGNSNGTRLDLGPRGADQEEGPEPSKMDCRTLIGLVELCLRGLDDPDERSQILGELATLLAGSDDQMMSTMPASAPPPSYSRAIDRRRGRNGRGARSRSRDGHGARSQWAEFH